MSNRNYPKLDLLNQYFMIDPTSKTGLRWIKTSNMAVRVGDEAGSAKNDGTFTTKLKTDRNVLNHFVIYAMHNNIELDTLHRVKFIDGDKSNLDPTNLQHCPRLKPSKRIIKLTSKKKNGKITTKTSILEDGTIVDNLRDITEAEYTFTDSNIIVYSNGLEINMKNTIHPLQKEDMEDFIRCHLINQTSCSPKTLRRRIHSAGIA